jgi:hypothetical protein
MKKEVDRILDALEDVNYILLRTAKSNGAYGKLHLYNSANFNDKGNNNYTKIDSFIKPLCNSNVKEVNLTHTFSNYVTVRVRRSMGCALYNKHICSTCLNKIKKNPMKYGFVGTCTQYIYPNKDDERYVIDL